MNAQKVIVPNFGWLVLPVNPRNHRIAAERKGKLTIWAWDPNFNIPVMAEAKARYQKLNPKVEIEIVEMAKADVEQRLNTVLASGAREGLPDIVLIEDYNAQKYLQAYPGAFVDLTKTINFKDFATYKPN